MNHISAILDRLSISIAAPMMVSVPANPMVEGRCIRTADQVTEGLANEHAIWAVDVRLAEMQWCLDRFRAAAGDGQRDLEFSKTVNRLSGLISRLKAKKLYLELNP